MADDMLGARIVNLFQSQNNQCLQASDISRQLRVHKKQLNVELYRLKRQGVLNKVQESPPVWQLSTTDFQSLSATVTRPHVNSRKKHENVVQKGKKFPGFKHGILSGNNRRKTSGVSREMMEQILVALQQRDAPTKTIDIAKAVGKSTSSEVNPSLYVLQKQKAIVRVTDQPATWAINSECKHEQQSINSSLELTNQKDVLLGMNSGIYDGSSDDTVNCSVTTGHYSGLGSMDMLDHNLEISNENSPNIDIGNLNVNSPKHEFNSSFQEIDFENEQYTSTPFSELGVDFNEQNVQNLDNEMEINNFDSQSKLYPESDNSEPKMLVQEQLQNISDTETGVQENITEYSDLRNTSDVVIHEDTEGEMSTFISSDTCGINICSVQSENEKESVLDDQDEVLKTLVACPMQTARLFILENKTKIPKENLQSILEKCKKDRYVNFQEPLWVMTREGVDYINKKLSKLGGLSKNNSSISSSVPVSKPSKTVFKGPPPSPFELLRKENSGAEALTQDSDKFMKQQNFQSLTSSASSVHGLTSTTSYVNTVQNLNRPPFSSSHGPVPLMSLDFTSAPYNTGGLQNSLQSKTVFQNSSGQSLAGSFQSQENSSLNSGPIPLMSFEASPINRLLKASSQVTGISQPQNTGMSLFSSRNDQISHLLKKQSTSSSSAPSGSSSNISSGNSSVVSSGLNFQQPSLNFTQMEYSRSPVVTENQTSSLGNQQGLNLSETNTKCGSSDRTSSNTESTVSVIGHHQTENLPAYARQIANSFTSTSSKLPDTSKLQSRSGVGQSMSVRFPLSRMQASTSSSKNSSISTGFKPPPSPFDLIRQQEVNSSTASLNPPQSLRPEFGGIAHQTSPNVALPYGANQIQTRGQLTGQPQSKPVISNTNQSRQISGPTSLDLTAESFAAVNKNPVSALMEYAQSRHKVARIEVINQSGPSHRPKFMMGVFIGDQQIASVMCSNKKDGRREVADKALRALIASGQYNVQSAPVAKPLVPAASMTHFDKIAALSHQAFNMLVAGIADNFAGRKVIAALVMKCSDTDVGTVVSVGSGNRCITGQQLSLEGNTVNDSHAEIITRRGFIRFLYKRLLAYDPNKSDMFEKAPSGKLRLRNGITLHLYISTAPCGDGALFSPRDASSSSGQIFNVNDRTHRPTFTTQAQGLVRTKMEGGEGTIPVEKDFTHQTFDGIQRGERLRTMSCTDKICRWNVVGMQGALLSHFLEPIYLDSLTLGLLYDHGHLARALCCRVARGDTNVDEILPPGYHLNHPWLGRVTACEPPREVQKTKALSINWCIGDEKAEVTDGTQGLLYTKIEKGLFSRCSKKNMYDSFKKVCQKYGCHHLLQAKTYNEAKQMATDFSRAKEAMSLKFKENGYGVWVSKPIEEELFS